MPRARANMDKNIAVGLGVVIGVAAAVFFVVFGGPKAEPGPNSSATSSPLQPVGTTPTPPAPAPGQPAPERVSVVGYWECLPKKGPGPHTMECAFGIAVDQSDGHLAINTALMSTYPVDFPTGSKVRVSGVIHPAEPNTSYDIDGVLWATTIEKL